MINKRNRYLYLILTILTMVLGILSRKTSNLPTFISAYSGDTLWALMVFFMVAFIFNKNSTAFVAGVALIFSYGIEISQIYHSPWINTIRSTTLGGLVLGFGFLWSDILCYTVGIGIGVIVDVIYIKVKKGNIKARYI